MQEISRIGQTDLEQLEHLVGEEHSELGLVELG
jgi:hypothetical protein